MSRKIVFATTLLVVLALVLAACDAATEAPTTETEAPVQVTVEVPVEVPVTPVPVGPYDDLARALAGEFAGSTVTMMGVYIGEDQSRFEAALVPFELATGIDVVYEGSADFETLIVVRAEGGDAPDVAQFSQVGLMAQLTDYLVPLDFMNMDQLAQDYAQGWIDMGTIDDSLYGIFYRANTKSIVWYPTPQFADAGYTVPETWDDLIALSDQMVSDGRTPWCIPIEHGGNTGWVATDWLEDILLRTAPVEIYDQWANHEIPFNHPEVVEAMDYMDDIWFNEDYVHGGREGILTIWVGETAQMFPGDDGSEPECWMMKQAGWIPAFFPEGKAAGTDASFFYFPPIEEDYGNPVLGAADAMALFSDSHEARALIEYLATPSGAEVWVKTGGFISPNGSVDLDWYANDLDRIQGEIMKNADVLRFDASDTYMPAEVGVGTFWTGMVDWVSGEKDTATVLQDIEDSWPD